jgi:hypothetical protein
MSAQKANLDLLLPPGRMVWGDLYKGRATDMDGRPLTYKSGADAGKPRVSFDFGIAIPKAGTTHWAQTEWGKKIWEFGHAQWPQGQAQRPDFAWKIEDGDGTTPNKRGRRAVDNPGYAGHWIVKLASSIAPKLYKMGPNGPVLYADVDAIKPGDWIEAYANIASNDTLNNPGLYLNHSMVCFRAFDKDGRFSFGPDVSQAGFGASGLGASATDVPVGGQSAFSAAVPVVPTAVSFAAPTVATVNPPPYAPPGLAAPAVPPAPPAAPQMPVGPIMLPKANGIPYEQWIAKGWTDETLRQSGYLQ